MENRTGRPQIVLIEDNPADVYLMKVALEESGVAFDMTSFQSGADALQALCPGDGAGTNSRVPDLILLDLNTPRSDGFDVLSSIRSSARLAPVPVVIVTSSSSLSDKQRAALLGATTYLQKPTQLADFVNKVGGAIKQLISRD